MGFTTYENRFNPHMTIHRDGCSQIRKRGDQHKYGQAEYKSHASYYLAHDYALRTGLPVWICSYCKPSGDR